MNVCQNPASHALEMLDNFQMHLFAGYRHTHYYTP